MPHSTESIGNVERLMILRTFGGFAALEPGQVAVLARLLARGFIDAPAGRGQTGLFDEDTPRATLFVRTPDQERTQLGISYQP